MHGSNDKFEKNIKVKPRLIKKELEIVDRGSTSQIKLLSAYRLNQYIKLVRKLRDKYRDITQRQKIALKKVQSNSQILRAEKKAKMFDKVLNAFESQSKKVKGKTSRKSQRILDHEQNSDLDGVIRIDGKVVIPANSKVKKVAQRKAAL